MPVIPATAGSINRRIVVKASLGKKGDPISKITREKRVESRKKGRNFSLIFLERLIFLIMKVM
jgi:hypothetical protein